LNQLLSATNFEPFSIVTSSGRRYPIPLQIMRGSAPTEPRRDFVLTTTVAWTLSALHIVAIEKES
jgi:hypothetical protein